MKYRIVEITLGDGSLTYMLQDFRGTRTDWYWADSLEHPERDLEALKRIINGHINTSEVSRRVLEL